MEKFVCNRAKSAGVEVTVFTVSRSPMKDRPFVSARVAVNGQAQSLLTRPTFWPDQIYCRRWKFLPRTSHDGQQQWYATPAMTPKPSRSAEQLGLTTTSFPCQTKVALSEKKEKKLKFMNIYTKTAKLASTVLLLRSTTTKPTASRTSNNISQVNARSQIKQCTCGSQYPSFLCATKKKSTNTICTRKSMFWLQSQQHPRTASKLMSKATRRLTAVRYGGFASNALVLASTWIRFTHRSHWFGEIDLCRTVLLEGTRERANHHQDDKRMHWCTEV